MRVKFTKRHCGYFEGADPDLDKEEAARLIKLGVCREWTPKDEPKPEPDAKK